MNLGKRKILASIIVSSMLLAGCTAESSVDDELLEDISETPDTNEESDPGSAPEEIIEVGES